MPGHEVLISRREILAAGAATASLAVLPTGQPFAQQAAKYRRLKVTNPRALRHLDSYKKAIRAMLELPPSDPRNWYRIALSHALDCPHGNWWFLVWHRGYIGWFERICRELSGDPEFSLPYWDWTEVADPSGPFAPRVPAVMFEDVLTPTHEAFIGKYDAFKSAFEKVIAQADYWKRISTNGEFDERTQYGQLLYRATRFPEDLWFDIIDDPRGKFFFDTAHARGVTKEKPELDERTAKSVSLPVLLDALSPRDFITFASPKTLAHSGAGGFGILEGQPHNRVHNNVGGISFKTTGDVTIRTDVGGFMQNFLSPVDPIFFLHHANIDRLWYVWTRKQQMCGYPIFPDGDPKEAGDAVPGSDYDVWSKEPFLFFIDSKGQPVSKTNAGDYAAIGEFDYDYQPGSGEEILAPIVAPVPAVQYLAAEITNPIVTLAEAAVSTVAIPPTVLEMPHLLAKITIAMAPFVHTDDLVVTIAGSGALSEMIPLSIFGHHKALCPMVFTVPLSETVVALRSSNQLGSDLKIDVAYQEAVTGHGVAPAPQTNVVAEVLSVVVEAH
jgi:tyrosinase